MITLNIDDTDENADWTKQTWDLPPYKSAEFNAVVSDIAHFRTLPIYEHAVRKGLIKNDRWTGNDKKNINTEGNRPEKKLSEDKLANAIKRSLLENMVYTSKGVPHKEETVTVKHETSGKTLRITKQAVARYKTQGYHPVK